MQYSPAQRSCIAILPQVSRSFALNIRVLGGDLYWSVLTAYLFCRIVDTVEDSEQLSSDTREKLLTEYIGLFKSRDISISQVGKWATTFGSNDESNPEHVLIAKCPSVFEVFLQLPDSSRQAISECVIEMATGMRKAVAGGPADGKLHVLETMAELEEYCYYVAGTVGKMLTRLFVSHSPSIKPSIVRKLEQLQVSFALGLQMTNIIKDCHDDFERGWCYVPVEIAQKHDASIVEFLELQNRERSLKTLDELIREAARHLDDAISYTLLIPRREVRMRLFNLWSLFFAIKTLNMSFHNADLLTGERKVKISRFEVYRTLVQTGLRVFSNSLLRSLYKKLRAKIPDKAADLMSQI